MTETRKVTLKILKNRTVKHPQTCGHIECLEGIYQDVDPVIAKAVERAGVGIILRLDTDRKSQGDDK